MLRSKLVSFTWIANTSSIMKVFHAIFPTPVAGSPKLFRVIPPPTPVAGSPKLFHVIPPLPKLFLPLLQIQLFLLCFSFLFF